MVRNMFGEEVGSHSRAYASGEYQIFESDGNAVQRAVLASRRYLAFGQRRFFERALCGDGDEGVRFVALDASEQRLHDLDRREASLPQLSGERSERAWQDYVVGQAPPSLMGVCSIS